MGARPAREGARAQPRRKDAHEQGIEREEGEPLLTSPAVAGGGEEVRGIPPGEGAQQGREPAGGRRPHLQRT